MAAPNSGIFVGDPVLSKRPPQERPDNGRSAAFFMATYDGNPISIINEGSSNMAGRSHLQITLPLPLLLPKPEVGAVPVLQQTTVSQSAKTIVCLPVGIHPDRPSALRLEEGAWRLASRAMESTKRNHLIEATAAAGQL